MTCEVLLWQVILRDKKWNYDKILSLLWEKKSPLKVIIITSESRNYDWNSPNYIIKSKKIYNAKLKLCNNILS